MQNENARDREDLWRFILEELTVPGCRSGLPATVRRVSGLRLLPHPVSLALGSISGLRLQPNPQLCLPTQPSTYRLPNPLANPPADLRLAPRIDPPVLPSSQRSDSRHCASLPAPAIHPACGLRRLPDFRPSFRPASDLRPRLAFRPAFQSSCRLSPPERPSSGASEFDLRPASSAASLGAAVRHIKGSRLSIHLPALPADTASGPYRLLHRWLCLLPISDSRQRPALQLRPRTQLSAHHRFSPFGAAVQRTVDSRLQLPSGPAGEPNLRPANRCILRFCSSLTASTCAVTCKL